MNAELKEQWKIKTDSEAEWWMEKNNEDLAEIRRYSIAIENKISELQHKLNKAKEEEQNIIQSRDSYLREYFEGLDKKLLKKTKTKIQYRLPSGNLTMKLPSPEYKRDNESLTGWLESNGLNDYVETKKTAKWGDLKKKTTVINGQVVYLETGEVVTGVVVVEREPEFKVEV